MTIPHRLPDRPVELAPGSRQMRTWEPPLDEYAMKDDGGVRARHPTEEEKLGVRPPGPNYLQALKIEREHPTRMCSECLVLPPRSTNAVRCLECETKLRKAIRQRADTGRRRHKTAAERAAVTQGGGMGTRGRA